MPGGKEPGSGKTPGSDGTPLGGHESDEANPGNRIGDGPPGSDAKRVAVQGSHPERWGTLPEHARAVFSSEGDDELPPRYRDWIDAYHRRLNRE